MTNDVQDIYELTPLQQGILFHSISSHDISAYNIQVSIHLHGELNLTVLKECLKILVQRHQVLRTSFIWERVEKPYQVVHTDAVLSINEISLQSFDEDEKKSKFNDFIQKDRTETFDLETAPLMRTTLLQLAENDYYFVWSYHHSILEGWSVSIILNELWQLYDAKVTGKADQLPPVQEYTNYIKWLKQQDLKLAENYWRNKLEGYSTPLQLPVDKGDVNLVADIVSTAFEHEKLSQNLTGQIQSFARETRVTINTVIEGALSLLLSRYTGENDIVFGAAVSGRPAEIDSVESIVGLFVNVLPVRVQINDSETIKNWLQRIQLDQVEMREYEYTPLLQIKSWSELSGAQPVFNVALAFENWLGDLPSNIKTGEIAVSTSDVFHTSDQPLTFFVTAGNELGVTLAYDTDRYDVDDVKRLLSCFVTLLTNLTDSSAVSLSDVSILSGEEKERLIYQWNQTEQPQLHNRLVHQSVEKLASDYPTQTALVSSDASLDYATLNQTANQLAHYLLTLGASSSTPIMVLMNRTPEMIVALLAILKTGSHYVPVDPECPEKRLTYMIDDTNSNIVITQSELASRVGNYSGHVVCMDEIPDELKEHSIDNPDVLVAPDHTAYIIYTSGSTGQPKGVEITHAGLTNLVAWHQREYQQGMSDRASHLAGLGFDATVWEIWPNITCGTSLYLVPDELRLSVSGLWQWIVEQGITLSFMPTPLAEAVLAEIPFDTLTNPAFALRVLHIAGDKLHGALSKQALPFRVANLYGPTENTVCSTFVDIDVLDKSEPTIGRPIDNVQIYILDTHMLPVPVGVIGDLYIGGKSLAKGYLNQPELNASQFVKNPFSKAENECLYNTGDLAKYRNDGLIEFAGRSDSQVKLRGFRIELGEIESVLTEFPGVTTAVVMIREDIKGDKRLAAYAVSKGKMKIPFTELRAHMEQRLPQYMVPASIEWLGKLPLTPNGKIDYRKLPVPSYAQKRTAELYNKPESEMETIMVKIWEELLEIDDIEPNDMFFDLGGHSLLILKVVERFEKETGIRLSPLSLMTQTLRQLVAGAEISKQEVDKLSEKSIIGSIKNTLLKRT